MTSRCSPLTWAWWTGAGALLTTWTRLTFCEKTYLTENLLAFLRELAARLSGDMSAPGVYRLQTEFGGGKTHTLLAAYHLFRIRPG